MTELIHEVEADVDEKQNKLALVSIFYCINFELINQINVFYEYHQPHFAEENKSLLSI